MDDLTEGVSGGGAAARGPGSPGAPKPLAPKGRGGTTAAQGEFNALHPRAAKGRVGGGQFATKSKPAGQGPKQKLPKSIAEFQKSRGLPVTGRMDSRTVIAWRNAQTAAREDAKTAKPTAASRSAATRKAVTGPVLGREEYAKPGMGSKHAPDARVKNVQGLLEKLGYDVARTGEYSEETEAAVRRFQADHGLPTTGIVSVATMRRLNKLHGRIAAGQSSDGFLSADEPARRASGASVRPKGSTGKVASVGKVKNATTVVMQAAEPWRAALGMLRSGEVWVRVLQEESEHPAEECKPEQSDLPLTPGGGAGAPIIVAEAQDEPEDPPKEAERLPDEEPFDRITVDGEEVRGGDVTDSDWFKEMLGGHVREAALQEAADWNRLLHPRGRGGRFRETFGMPRIKAPAKARLVAAPSSHKVQKATFLGARRRRAASPALSPGGERLLTTPFDNHSLSKGLATAMAAVAGAHEWPEMPPDVSFRVEPLQGGAAGEFGLGQEILDEDIPDWPSDEWLGVEPRDETWKLQLDPKTLAKNQEAYVFAHESGHMLDAAIAYREQGRNRKKHGGYFASALAAAPDAMQHMKPEQVQAWRAFLMTAVTPSVLLSRMPPDYFRSPQELWARAYGQWIGTLDDTDSVARAVSGAEHRGSTWPADEWEPVGRAVEAVLRAHGLLASEDRHAWVADPGIEMPSIPPSVVRKVVEIGDLSRTVGDPSPVLRHHGFKPVANPEGTGTQRWELEAGEIGSRGLLVATHPPGGPLKLHWEPGAKLTRGVSVPPAYPSALPGVPQPASPEAEAIFQAVAQGRMMAVQLGMPISPEELLRSEGFTPLPAELWDDPDMMEWEREVDAGKLRARHDVSGDIGSLQGSWEGKEVGADPDWAALTPMEQEAKLWHAAKAEYDRLRQEIMDNPRGTHFRVEHGEQTFLFEIYRVEDDRILITPVDELTGADLGDEVTLIPSRDQSAMARLGLLASSKVTLMTRKEVSAMRDEMHAGTFRMQMRRPPDDDLDWRSGHRPPTRDDGVGMPLHDLTQNMPEDVYTHPHYYGGGGGDPDMEKAFRESVAVLRRVRNKPDAMVRIYRALPPEFVSQGFHEGDWVTTSPTYARIHARHADDPSKDWPVISTMVPADDVWTHGDSLNEYGYVGPSKAADGDSTITLQSRPAPPQPPWPGGIDWDADPDAAMAAMAAHREQKRAWEAEVSTDLSLGHVTWEAAREAGFGSAAYPWEPMPDVPLYHATTALGRVQAEGLKTRRELGQSLGAGLGGGDDGTISVTTNREVADAVALGLREMRAVARGDTDVLDMLAKAQEGDGSKPFAWRLVRHYQPGEWLPGDPWPDAIRRLLEGKKVAHLAPLIGTREEVAKEYGIAPDLVSHTERDYSMLGNGARGDWEVPMSPEEQLDAAVQFYKAYAAFRQEAGGVENPMFFSSDTRALAQTPLDQIGVVTVRPAPGAQGYKVAGMDEWRTGSGRAFVPDAPPAPITHQARPAGSTPQEGDDPHTTVLPRLYHSTDREGELDFSAEMSRWGHGGVFFTVQDEGGPVMSRNRQDVFKGPFTVYEVLDDDTGSAHLWRGYGKDEAFNALLMDAAREVGLPAQPGIGFGEQLTRLNPDTGESERNPDWKAFVEYAHGLQAAVAAKLRAQGYDGMWVGGEVVVWNYDKLNAAKVQEGRVRAVERLRGQTGRTMAQRPDVGAFAARLDELVDGTAMPWHSSAFSGRVGRIGDVFHVRAQGHHQDVFSGTRDEVARWTADMSAEGAVRHNGSMEPDVQEAWDEARHPRDEHGRFSEVARGIERMGGSPDLAQAFASGTANAQDVYAAQRLANAHRGSRDYVPKSGARLVDENLGTSARPAYSMGGAMTMYALPGEASAKNFLQDKPVRKRPIVVGDLLDQLTRSRDTEKRAREVAATHRREGRPGMDEFFTDLANDQAPRIAKAAVAVADAAKVAKANSAVAQAMAAWSSGEAYWKPLRPLSKQGSFRLKSTGRVAPWSKDAIRALGSNPASTLHFMTSGSVPSTITHQYQGMPGTSEVGGETLFASREHAEAVAESIPRARVVKRKGGYVVVHGSGKVHHSPFTGPFRGDPWADAFAMAEARRVEAKLAEIHAEEFVIAEAADSLKKASTPSPLSTSKTSNWVARNGGLPAYIQHIAKALMKDRGKTESEAVRMAIGIVKRWARGGGNVDAGTKAAAMKAVGEWNALKARAHAS